LTEDIDVAIPEGLVEREGARLAAALQEMGFVHEPGTATFVGSDGVVFDLLGFGAPQDGDHVAGSGVLRVMVFQDLSRLIGAAAGVQPLASGGRGLTPAGFVAAKLLTERGHKGAKDKLQALLVISEHDRDEAFATDLAGLLASFEAVRREDVRAAAQEALLALGHDPAFADAGAEGYAASINDAERGLGRLQSVLDRVP
jgi:hypothetical protein